MTAQETALPPEEDWLPGRLLGRVVLQESDQLCVAFEDADLYPMGILLRLSARFRELPTLEAQREAAGQVMAFHRGADHDGPHLRYMSDGRTADALPWAHGGAQRLWRMGFWIACDEAPLDYELDWPSQSIRTAFSLIREQLIEAQSEARQLWPAGGHHPGSIRIAVS